MLVERLSRGLGAAVLVALLSMQSAGAGPQEDFERAREAYYRGDLIEAMRLLRLASSDGHTSAQTLLAYILDRAEENQEAASLFRSAAEAGDVEAMYGLGVMYAAGEGVPADLASARAWLERSADGGYGHSLVVLADAHLNGGLGLEPDRSRAIELLKRGAALGYIPAREKLAILTAKP